MKTEHKFFKKDGVWFVWCGEKNGSFSTEMWRNEQIPDKFCPCCKRDISIDLRVSKTLNQVARGNQKTL
jgi:hypothetical protein